MNKKEAMFRERRSQLMNIGLDQFIGFGYRGTSTRRICELAGISSGLSSGKRGPVNHAGRTGRFDRSRGRPESRNRKPRRKRIMGKPAS